MIRSAVRLSSNLEVPNLVLSTPRLAYAVSRYFTCFVGMGASDDLKAPLDSCTDLTGKALGLSQRRATSPMTPMSPVAHTAFINVEI
jgi:hypothetical protein